VIFIERFYFKYRIATEVDIKKLTEHYLHQIQRNKHANDLKSKYKIAVCSFIFKEEM